MKLSELLIFKRELNSLLVNDVQSYADQKLNIITHLIESQHLAINLSPLESKRSEIKTAFDNFQDELSKIKNQLDQFIVEAEKPWFQESYKVFEDAKDCETTEQILNNRIVAKTEAIEEAERVLKVRLASHGDWQYPGMIIRPGLEDVSQNMVGYDPLYIIDRNYDLLQPFMNRFNKLYQNRLRRYIVDDWTTEPLFGKIPDTQFGTCLAYNVFNFRPLEIIRKYLKEIYIKLRPGGIVLMTYNDCDLPNAVELVEKYYASYTPGYLVRELAKNIGFEITYIWNTQGPSVWMELRRPGELTSIRGGQVVAAIHSKMDYLYDIDFEKNRAYSKEEIAKLHERAIAVEIEPEVIESMSPFELKMYVEENEAIVAERHRLEEERLYKEKLRERAAELNIDIDHDNWEDSLIETLRQIDEAAIEKEKEAERQRVEALHNQARSLDIDPETVPNEDELKRLIAEAIDNAKKRELIALRKRALELGVGDPNLVKYGYSAHKLKELIEEKENK